jgi:hypothetical protein
MASWGERLRAAARPQRAGGASPASPGSTDTRVLPPPSSAVVVPRPTTVDEAPWEAVTVPEASAAGLRPASAIALRRERRELASRYDVLQRDIGGLAIEMARQANYNYPLLRARAEEALRIEQRVAEIDAVLDTMIARRRLERIRGRSPVPRPPTRVAAELPPATRACPRCAATIPSEANFCGMCGATVTG